MPSPYRTIWRARCGGCSCTTPRQGATWPPPCQVGRRWCLPAGPGVLGPPSCLKCFGVYIFSNVSFRPSGVGPTCPYIELTLWVRPNIQPKPKPRFAKAQILEYRNRLRVLPGVPSRPKNSCRPLFIKPWDACLCKCSMHQYPIPPSGEAGYGQSVWAFSTGDSAPKVPGGK